MNLHAYPASLMPKQNLIIAKAIYGLDFFRQAGMQAGMQAHRQADRQAVSQQKIC